MKRIAIACLSAALCLPNAVADPPEASSSFERRFHLSVSRADEESDPASWLEAARDAASTALSLWEREAAELYADPRALERDAAALEAWTEGALASRYAAWLDDRFFGREAARLLSMATAAVDDARASLLYESEADGSIRRDASGDPVVLSSESGRDLEVDRAAWRRLAAEARDATGETYALRLEALRPELLAFVPEAGRKAFAAAVDEAARVSVGRVALELDALAAREESLFVARRSSDSYSLRHKSEGEAASAIADGLARAAEADCETAMASLEAGLEAAAADPESVDVTGKDWLASFSAQFDRGLEAWARAEERFMVRRVEWERDAAESFESGNRAWAEAFETLSEARSSWESRARRLLESGEAAFDSAGARLEEDIAAVRDDFERDAALRYAASSERAAAWVDAYAEAGLAVASARQAAAYWMGKAGLDDVEEGSPEAAALLSALASSASATEARKSASTEGLRWLSMRDEYAARAAEARDRLLSDFALAIGAGAGPLSGVLDEGAALSGFCLDEYQVELLRAKAVVGYWSRREDIAASVYDYALDASSGRDTEAESAAAWDGAFASYEAAMDAYEAAVAGLESARAAVSGAEADIAEARVALEAAAAAMGAADREYASLVSALALGSDAFLASELLRSYSSLRALDYDGSSDTEALVLYIEKARALGFEECVEASAKALRDAVRGVAGEPSLAELLATIEAIVVPETGSGLLSSAGEYGVAESDPGWRDLEALLAGSGAVPDESREALVASAVCGARRRAEAALAARVCRISLLAADDAAAWYESSSGATLADGEGVAGRLESDASEALRLSIRARASLERRALALVAVSGGASGPGDSETGVLESDAALLATCYQGTREEASLESASLSSLIAALDAAAGEGRAALRAACEGLASGDARVARFLRGLGSFSVDGVDAGGLCSSEAGALALEADGRQAAYAALSGTAACLEEERKAGALSILASAFADLGLAMDGGLPAIATVAGAAATSEAGTASAVTAFSRAVQEAASLAPAWMSRRLVAWKDALVAAAAAVSVQDGSVPSRTTAELRAALLERRGRAAVLTDAVGRLGLGGDTGIEAMADALSSLGDSMNTGEAEVFEGELVRRMARSLYLGIGAADDTASEGDASAPADDMAGIAEAVTAAADERFAFASADLRARAVSLALDYADAARAEAERTPPDDLSDYARASRLAALWSSLDADELSEVAAGGALKVARYLEDARVDMGEAAAVAERVLAICLAIRVADSTALSAALGEAGLSGCGDAASFMGKTDTDILYEAFMGLPGGSALAAEAAGHYLAILALKGDAAGVERASAVAPAGASERAGRLLSVVRAASSYCPGLSGDAVAWARGKSGDHPAMLVALLRLAQSGVMDDPLADALGLGLGASGSSDPFDAWTLALVSDAVTRLMDEASDLSCGLEFSEARARFASSVDEAGRDGTMHWRQAIALDLAAVEASDGSSGPESAASWAEGETADRLEDAAREDEALASALSRWDAATDSAAFIAFREHAGGFVAEPDMAYDWSVSFVATAATADACASAATAVSRIAARRDALRRDMSALGSAYASAASDESARLRLAAMDARRAETAAAYEAAMAACESAADGFGEAGSLYDEAFARASAAYDDAESRRLDYDRQEAIRLWARNAYLSATGATGGEGDYRSPSAELAYARDGLAKASAALAALESLYDDDASMPYEDDDYAAAYEEYRRRYERAMLAAKARDAVESGLSEAREASESARAAYSLAASSVLSSSPRSAMRPYLRVTDDGRLALAFGDSFAPGSASVAAELDSYLGDAIDASGPSSATRFSQARDELLAWMDSVSFDEGRAESWGLAMDYVVRMAGSRDAAFAKLASVRSAAVFDGSLGTQLIDGVSVSSRLAAFREGELLAAQKDAFEGLSGDERSRFDFFVALKLSGCADDGSDGSAFDSLSYWSRSLEFRKLDGLVRGEIDECARGVEEGAKTYAALLAAVALMGLSVVLAPMIPTMMVTVGITWAATLGCALVKSGWEDYRALYSQTMDATTRGIAASAASFGASLRDVASLRAASDAADERLARLEASGPSGADVGWDALRSALTESAWLDEEELGGLESLWRDYGAAGAPVRSNAGEALSALASWAGLERDDAAEAVESAFEADAAARADASAAYRVALTGYAKGATSEAELSASMRAAFGRDAASLKTHLARMAAASAECGGLSLSPLGGLAGERAAAAAEYAAVIGRVDAARAASALAAREAEWASRRLELDEKRRSLEGAMTLALADGRSDFDASLASMRSAYASWAGRFARVYGGKAAAWDALAAEAFSRKEAWVRDSGSAARAAATEAAFAAVGIDAEAAARSVDTMSVARVAAREADASSMTARLLETTGMDRLAGLVRTYASSAARFRSGLALGAPGPALWDAPSASVAAARLADESRAALAAGQARLLASSARDAIAAAMDSLARGVDAANDSFDDAMDRSFVADGGWAVSGGYYSKDVVVHSTVLDGYLTENARVRRYQPFALGPWSPRTDLSDGALARFDSDGVRASIAAAQKEGEAMGELVFGSADETAEGAAVPESRKHAIYFYTDAYFGSSSGFNANCLATGAARVLDEAKTIVRVQSPGLFGAWIGWEPTLDPSGDPNDGPSAVLYDAGSGELGRLLGEYYYWSAREGLGWTEASKAFYDKDLWDDRNSWFESLTIRTAADITMSVAAAALSGGTSVLAGAALGLVDDALFGLLDVSGGRASAESATVAFAGKAASAAIGLGSGALFGGLGSALAEADGFGAVIGGAALSGLESASATAASSAARAFYWDDESGSLAWSEEAFSRSLGSGLAGVAGSMASSLATGGLGLVDLQDGNGIVLADTVFDVEGIAAFNSIVGGAAGQAVSYALGGEAVFNLANLDLLGFDLGGDATLSSGLLELRLGRDGVSMGFGTAGADLSLGRLASAAAGLSDAAKVAGAKIASSFGSYEAISDLDAINLLGHAGGAFGVELARDIWGGLVDTNYADELSVAEGYYGSYDGSSAGTMNLSSELAGLGVGKAAIVAALMAHEGAHMAGVGVEGEAVALHLDTYASITAMLGLDMDAAFVDASFRSLADPASWRERTGGLDYFRVRLDGSVYDDHRDGEVSYEDGRATVVVDGGGKQGTLEAWLGGEGSAFNAYTTFLKASGYRYENGVWSGSAGISRSQIELAYSQGRISEEQYRLIVGDDRSEADVTRGEQKLIRLETARAAARTRLAALVAAGTIVPSSTAYGSGAAGDPYVYTGQGGLDQIQAAELNGYDPVGPCYLMGVASPFLRMGYSADAILAALKTLPAGAVRSSDAMVYNTATVWSHLQKALKAPGVPQWVGGAQADTSWAQLLESGADMGVMWIKNPYREESWHWGFLYRSEDSWYFSDPWNSSDKGVLLDWGVESWEEIKSYRIRPIEYALP